MQNNNGDCKLKQNIQDQTISELNIDKIISELYTDNKKSKHFSNPNYILKSAKNFEKEQRPKVPLSIFLVKFITGSKSQIDNFTIVRQPIFWKT